MLKSIPGSSGEHSWFWRSRRQQDSEREPYSAVLSKGHEMLKLSPAWLRSQQTFARSYEVSASWEDPTFFSLPPDLQHI
uniref:Uncharacterized protein n=1 Tax=Ditylenchus dipsaci TaxID=166011 RepID=A0A915CSK6_9BILA